MGLGSPSRLEAVHQAISVSFESAKVPVRRAPGCWLALFVLIVLEVILQLAEKVQGFFIEHQVVVTELAGLAYRMLLVHH